MSKTIKVIDLLNKIANGENLPEKVLIEDEVYYLIEDDEGNKVYSQGKSTSNWENFIDHKMNVTRSLKEEVLILDDELVIEELGKMAGWALVSLEENIEKQKESINFTSDFFGKMINEIITNQNKIIKAVKQLDNQINNK